jgi:hypothetical protein
MALILADRVKETSTTTGTGTLTLDGAVTSYQSFAAIGNANTTYYTIVNQNAAEWEVGVGTYTSSGTTLARTTVLSSSNSGSLVNFSAGTKDVWGDYPAGKAVTTDTLTAAANAGIAIVSNVYSTTYNSTISDSLTVPNTVGGITAGTTAATLKAKNIVQIVDDLLFPTVLPTYTIPVVSIFTASASGYQEIGQTISQALNQTQNKNDAGVYSSLVFKRGGSVISTSSSPTGTSIADIAAQFGYADPNNPNYSYSQSYTDSFTVVSGATSWTAEGTYGAGLAKKDNKGNTDTRTAAVRSVNAPQAAATLASGSKSITGIYPYFWGVSNTAPTAASIASAIAAGSTNKVVSDAGSSITITFNASGQYVWFATAASYADKTTWYNTPLNNGTIGPGQFILSPVTQNVNSPNGYWSTVSFKIYISGYATTTSGSIIFS